jgi:ABC-type multidrug transport system ATPase subunit
MYQINLENLGKKFQTEWIFRNLHFQITQGEALAVIGANGSGKSTLLQIIAGNLTATSGKISYQMYNQAIPVEIWYKKIALAAPYLELIEEFTLLELVNFQLKFKKLQNNLSSQDFIQQIGLGKAIQKPIKYFSSGMKQRLKLGLAFYTDTPVLLLDEPTTNLDRQGFVWYQSEIQKNLHRLVIICSNQPAEYEVCTTQLDIMQYK